MLSRSNHLTRYSRTILQRSIPRNNAVLQNTFKYLLYPITQSLYSTTNSVSSSSQQGSGGISIFEGFKTQAKLNQLRKMIEENPNTDETAVLNYVRALSTINPTDTAAYIERGWANGKISLNEDFLKEYLKAVATIKKLDQLNISGLLQMITAAQKQRGSSDARGATIDQSAPLTHGDLVNLLRSTALGAGGGGGGLSFAGVSSGGGSSSPFSAGSSPMTPLYIVQQDTNWKNQIWTLFRHAITLFIVVSFVGTLLDDKGAASSISSKITGLKGAIHQAEKSDKTFADVVGIDEAKSELEEIVMYLKDPKKFTRLGGRLPKGILLTGPPGTGKTLLARAIAGEAGVSFFHASGSEFEEMYVGVGAKRVRELFEIAKQKSPCIIFIDEIDAIGGSRHVKDQSAMKMTLNQLLVEMDGFQQNTGIVVIAATNFPDSLDNALIRPGRFDKHVDVPMPDIGGRKAILSLYLKKVPLEGDVDLEQLARGTPGFSGAELFNLTNQAALKASVDGLNAVNMKVLEYAKDKIMMGAERRTAVISPETMKMTAFHEAGHALVALLTKGADPIHKATIMPRGRALGMVIQLPEGDQTSMSRQQMLARLDVAMGGRVAEELIFGADNVTSGATSDLAQATRLARAMVTKYGLSTKLGVFLYVDDNGSKGGSSISPSTQEEIDREVRRILEESHARAKAVLEGNKKELEIIAMGLMEYESLSGSEVVDLVNGKKISQLKRSEKPSRQMKSIEEMTVTRAAPGSSAKAAEAKAPSSVAATPAPTTSNASSAKVATKEIPTPATNNNTAASSATTALNAPTTTTTASSTSTTPSANTTGRGPPKA